MMDERDHVIILEATLWRAIVWLEHYGPRKPHVGPCTPESNCDSSCMEFAVFACHLRDLRRVLRPYDQPATQPAREEAR